MNRSMIFVIVAILSQEVTAQDVAVFVYGNDNIRHIPSDTRKVFISDSNELVIEDEETKAAIQHNAGSYVVAVYISILKNDTLNHVYLTNDGSSDNYSRRVQTLPEKSCSVERCFYGAFKRSELGSTVLRERPIDIYRD